MRRKMLRVTLAVLSLDGLIVACSPLLEKPTPTPLPTVTSTATQTPPPTPTFTLAAPPPTATRVPPTRTATRAPLPTRTRAPVTVAPTRPPPSPVVWDTRLDELGIQLIPAAVQAGQSYWRLMKAEFWDEKHNQGKHHIFINVLDERGTRLLGQKVTVEWPGEKQVLVTEDKPAPEYSANFPLHINHYPPWGTLGAFTVQVDGLPSEKVAGLGLPSRNQLVVYLLTFQRAVR
jgi:hypothetical protein